MSETVYENQFQVLYMYIGPDQQFKHKRVIILSIICLNICFGCTKELAFGTHNIGFGCKIRKLHILGITHPSVETCL